MWNGDQTGRVGTRTEEVLGTELWRTPVTGAAGRRVAVQGSGKAQSENGRKATRFLICCYVNIYRNVKTENNN